MIASLLLPLLLQSADAYPECNREAADMGLQQEMNICAHRDFLTADAAMNAQWRLTRAHMQERDAQWDPAWDAGQGASEEGRQEFATNAHDFRIRMLLADRPQHGRSHRHVPHPIRKHYPDSHWPPPLLPPVE